MESMETQNFPMALIGTPGKDLTTPWKKSEWWSEKNKNDLEESVKISISSFYVCKVYGVFFSEIGLCLVYMFL